MKQHVLAGAMLAGLVSSPLFALEHEVVIDHDGGMIAADYRGTITIRTTQTGAVGAAGRPSTLACRWTASLTVERAAKMAQALTSHRTLTSENVVGGVRPGWCQTQSKAIAHLIDARRDSVRRTMMAMVDQDRAALLAEADGVAGSPRG